MPILTYTFLDDAGNPVDLTGATVTLNYQNLRDNAKSSVSATITDALAGTVEYQWDADDTLDPGDYVYSWTLTFSGGRSQTYPEFPAVLEFSIGPAISDSMPIASFRTFIRTLLGDNHPTIKTYEAVQIDDAVRLIINLGQITGVTLSTDGTSLVPALAPLSATQTDTTVAKNWARVVYYAAKRFVAGNPSSYSFRTRALSESFGEQRDMMFELLQDVYELDNGDQCSASPRAHFRSIC